MKTEQAVSFLRAGNLKDALRIFRTFRIGFSKEERRIIQIAYESLAGKDAFYTSLGIDTAECILKSKQILTEKYLKVHS